jgi:hypothetical protein
LDRDAVENKVVDLPWPISRKDPRGGKWRCKDGRDWYFRLAALLRKSSRDIDLRLTAVLGAFSLCNTFIVDDIDYQLQRCKDDADSYHENLGPEAVVIADGRLTRHPIPGMLDCDGLTTADHWRDNNGSQPSNH